MTGQVESSGGFEKDVTVNDAGDLLVYKVSGVKRSWRNGGCKGYCLQSEDNAVGWIRDQVI